MISLLADHVANQIAAGEVVQRPSSAVKELIENAIDAQSKDIKLVIKDSGKTMIQVIDDGMGMNKADAKMCFERHATSKISKADDLFTLQTKGFRGEALASIAAISQVELKTKTKDSELGIKLHIEGSEFKSTEICTCQKGTSFIVKNLFYNVPARRNFLKSDRVELKLISEEFIRIALGHPKVSFSMFHNDKEIHRLPKETLRKRLVSLFGKNYNTKLVPVNEETDIVKVSGFVCKPEFFKKSRGEQYLFVNDRFIKSSYMNHAVQNAMEGLIQVGHHPSFFLFLSVDPSKIDVNIHPTKTEIKFEDEKQIYAIIRSAIKHSIGQYNIAPSLDFSLNPEFNIMPSIRSKSTKPPTIHVDSNFNPFDSETKKIKSKYSSDKNIKGTHWEAIFKEMQVDMDSAFSEEPLKIIPLNEEIQDYQFVVQIKNRFIFTPIKSGLLFIDQKRAHERILFEKYYQTFVNSNASSQILAFPKEVHLNKIELDVFKEFSDDITSFGFDFTLNESGINFQGTPADIPNEDIEEVVSDLLLFYKENQKSWKQEKGKAIAKIFAKKNSIKAGEKLQSEEMNQIIDELFACEMPFSSISSQPTAIVIELNELIKRFN